MAGGSLDAVPARVGALPRRRLGAAARGRRGRARRGGLGPQGSVHFPSSTRAQNTDPRPAIVYARAPPSFQARYFSFRPAPISSPTPQPYSSSPPPYPQLSTPSLALSLQHNLGGSLAIDYPSRSPSPGYATGQGLNASVGHLPRSHSPAPSQRTIATTMTTVGALTRFPTTMNPTLFAHELEYLYTGKNFGAAFEFLFDAADSKTP